MSSKEKLYPYFLSLSLENVRCFSERVTLDLSDGNGKPARWTLILGENGMGKTTLLRAITASYFRHERSGDHASSKENFPFLPNEIPFSLFKREGKGKYSIVSEVVYSGSLTSSGATLENSFAPEELRGGWRYLGKVIDPPKEAVFQSLLGYGASRIVDTSAITDKMRSFAPATLFDEQAKLFNVEEWLIQEDYRSLRNNGQNTTRLERIKALILDLLGDEVSDIRFETEGDAPHVLLKTFSGWVRIHDMSLGYKTLMAWVIDAARWMFEVYQKDLDNPLEGPAIMLVDEIDLHMHPALQRRLFDFLTEKFPNTQFIVTAHSPLIVQASQDANIAVLKREGDHVIIENNPTNIRNWRVDQILTSDLFGLDSAHNPHTAEQLRKRVVLTQKKDRTKEEDQELRKLNLMVDAMPTGSDSSEREAESVMERIADLIRKEQKTS